LGAAVTTQPGAAEPVAQDDFVFATSDDLPAASPLHPNVHRAAIATGYVPQMRSGGGGTAEGGIDLGGTVSSVASFSGAYVPGPSPARAAPRDAVLPFLSAAARRSLHALLPLDVQQCDWECVYSSRVHGSSFDRLYERCAATQPCLLVVKARPLLRVGVSADVAAAMTDGTIPSENAPDSAEPQYTIFGAFIEGALSIGARATGESFVWRFIEAPASATATPTATAAATGAERGSSVRAPSSAVVESAGEATEGSHGITRVEAFRWLPSAGCTNSHFIQTTSTVIRVGAGGGGAAILLSSFLRSGATYQCDTFASPPLVAGVDQTGAFLPSVVEVYGFTT
jgi:hypothetical protein